MKTGICELRGCEWNDLRRLVLWDYVGWTCSKCIEQIRDDYFEGSGRLVPLRNLQNNTRRKEDE